MRANPSGSFSAIQTAFGAVNPGITALPPMPRNSGMVTSICSACAAARVSFHRIQGRITSSAASSAVSPCIWPDRPMARTAAICGAASRASAVTAASVACHQACGSCSDHPACGRLTASDADRLPITMPVSSARSAFTAEVPRSSPRYMNRLPFRVSGAKPVFDVTRFFLPQRRRVRHPPVVIMALFA